jgi:hypothetical protein
VKQKRTVATCARCRGPFVAVVRHTVGSRAPYHETRCEACRAILSARAHESAASKLRARALEAKLRTARAVAKFRQKYGGTHCARCAAGESCSIVDAPICGEPQ